jgi:hypothetical protein
VDDQEEMFTRLLEHQHNMWPLKIEEMKEMPARFRGGDWFGLAEYLKDGGRVTPEIRLALVDALSGVLKQPRRKKMGPKDIGEHIAVEVMRARLRGKKNVTESRTRSARQVSRYLEKHGEVAREVAILMHEVDSALAQGVEKTIIDKTIGHLEK